MKVWSLKLDAQLNYYFNFMPSSKTKPSVLKELFFTTLSEKSSESLIFNLCSESFVLVV